MIYIFDIDGTLTDERFYNDQVRELKHKQPILTLAHRAQDSPEDVLFIVTARGEHLRVDTEYWLAHHKLKPVQLFMRAHGDTRPDHKVRVDQVATVQSRTSGPWVLFDDNESNCREVKANLGVPCIHVR